MNFAMFIKLWAGNRISNSVNMTGLNSKWP